MTNYTNKQSFVNLLVQKLELHGFKVVLCPSDADIIIKKKSLQVENHFTVTILADDTDIFYLFLHHIHYSSNKNEIYKKNMSIQKRKGERVSYNIHDIISSTEKEYLEHLLLCHALQVATRRRNAQL